MPDQAPPDRSISWGVSKTTANTTQDTGFWKTRKAERMGMDSRLLEKGIDEFKKNRAAHSLLVARRGKIVVEEYFTGTNENTSYEIASAAKSFMSALAGIAISEGLIESVEQPVSELLPDLFTDPDDPRIMNLTVRHLLTMRGGLFWEPVAPLDEVNSYNDFVYSLLHRELEFNPGARFMYSTGLVHLMSAIITSRSGQDLYAWSYEKLFRPLGICPDIWGIDGDGNRTGGWYMYFTPKEMLTFGQLFLQDGEWEGKQLVPKEWVRESTTRRAGTLPGGDAYGYWWWRSQYGGYPAFSARGSGGQTIAVIPYLKMVVVTTFDHRYQGRHPHTNPTKFIEDYIVRSVKDP